MAKKNTVWPLGVRMTRDTVLYSKGRWSGRGHAPQGMTDLGHWRVYASVSKHGQDPKDTHVLHEIESIHDNIHKFAKHA